MPYTPESGTLLLCQDPEEITEVLDDRLDLFKHNPPPLPLESVLEPESYNRASSLFGAALQKHKTENLRVHLHDKFPVRNLRVWAVPVSRGLLLFCVEHDELPEMLYWSLLQEHVSSSGTPALLLEARNLVTLSGSTELHESEHHFHELTRVNNELGNARRELQKKKTELENLVSFKDQMMGMAAHDMRNPLSSIMSLSNMLEEWHEMDEEEIQKFVGMIKSSSEYMLSLIEETLEYREMESGRINLNLSTFQVEEIINRVISINERLAGKRNIKLQTTNESNAIQVTADPLKLEQVLNNLISNAIKFSPQNSEVRLSIYRNDADTGVVFAIRDEGPGIPEDKQKEIFKPFNKIRTQTDSKERSSGLGLSISKQIANAHGGDIHVDSQPGRGSEFRFVLPL